MTMTERRDAYVQRYPTQTAAHPRVVREDGREVIYATWVIGASFRNLTRYYGAYPKGYLDRVAALFPDVDAADTLHVFSGSLPPGRYTRCDVNPANGAELVCPVEELPARFPRRVPLVLADPPYSPADADRYGTPMVDRRAALAAIAAVTAPGGHLVWLACDWPIHTKREWVKVGRITLIRSTNHRVRLVSIFERVA